MKLSDVDALDALAVEYCGGSLDADAVAAFEARLRDEPEAVEALARVVLLMQATVARTVARRVRFRTLRVAAAAVLLLGVGIVAHLEWPRAASRGMLEVPSASAAPELEDAWLAFGAEPLAAPVAAERDGEPADADPLPPWFADLLSGD